MINIKLLREFLVQHICFYDKTNKSVKNRITIKRKKRMVLEQNSKGDIKAKRKNIIKIEIIE